MTNETAPKRERPENKCLTPRINEVRNDRRSQQHNVRTNYNQKLWPAVKGVHNG